jgi:hypothetical protein
MRQHSCCSNLKEALRELSPRHSIITSMIAPCGRPTWSFQQAASRDINERSAKEIMFAIRGEVFRVGRVALTTLFLISFSSLGNIQTK